VMDLEGDFAPGPVWKGGGVMGGKARKRNRLRLIMRRSQLRKARKEAEKARKKGGTSGGVKR